MKNVLLNGFLLASVFTVWAAPSLSIAAEHFPTRPIKLLIGNAPGGGGDLPLRYLADFAPKILGQPMVVVNKPGAGGSISLRELKDATPDGYTIGFLASGGIISALMMEVPYHPVQDFDPIIQHTTAVFGLVVRADSPFETVKGLISYAKANPYKVSYSTSGVGTPQHLVMVLLGEAADVKWTHVAYRGAAHAVTAVLGGHVTAISQTPIWKPHVDAGRLRLIASLMEKRMASYPNVPTLIEEGYNVKVPPIVYSVVGPKGIPKERLQILHDFFRGGMETPGYKEVLDAFDYEVYYRNPEDLKEAIKEVYESVGNIIKTHGIKKGR